MINAVQTRYGSIFDATIGKLWVTRVWDGIDRKVPSTRPMLERADTLLAIGLGLVGVAVSLWAFAQTNRVPEIHTMSELWLQADVPKYSENVVSTGGHHGRTSVHPIFSILLYPFGKLLTMLGAEPLVAAKSLIVLIMGANAALFALTTRLLGLPRYAVAIFTLLFVTTASFIFWGAVVETFPFSCFTVLMALFMMFRVKTAHWGWWIVVSVLTLGFLITNWMFGLIAMAVRLKLKPFLAICMSSLSLVVVLAIIQNATFERAALFFNPDPLLREIKFMQPAMEAEGTYEEGWRPTSNLRSIYVTTTVAMPVYIQQQRYLRLTTTNQNSAFPEGELTPIIAVVAWVLLLGLGIWGAASRRDIRLPVMAVGLLLAVQTALHLVYGEVTFLYSLSFMPLIMLIVACAWFSPYRKVALVMAGVVIVFGGINNERRMQETVEVTGCLAEVETVKQLQTWDLAKHEIVLDPSDYDELTVDTDNLCNTKTPS